MVFLLFRQSSGAAAATIDATADYVVRMPADDCVVQIPADDVVVRIPADETTVVV